MRIQGSSSHLAQTCKHDNPVSAAQHLVTRDQLSLFYRKNTTEANAGGAVIGAVLLAAVAQVVDAAGKGQGDGNDLSFDVHLLKEKNLNELNVNQLISLRA